MPATNNRALRIVHLLGTPRGKPGGLEKHTLDLCAELGKHHEVHLIADPGFAPHCAGEVHFHGVDFTRSRWNPLLYLQIAAIVRHVRPEVLHAQAGKAATVWRTLRRMFPGIACVGTQHGKQRNLAPYLAMDRVITVSAALAERYPPGRATVVHNGLRLPPPTAPEAIRALRAELAAGSARPLLIAVGRLDAVKGFDILLRALAGLDARLVLVGDGDERASLETLAGTLGVAGQVNFLGWRQDIPALLAAADLCVIASRSEGFPLVMVEALHAGTPLVSTDVSGVRELLPADLLAPVEDAPALHALLQRQIAGLPALRARLQPVFAHARRELTLDGMARRTEAIYLDAIAARHRARGTEGNHE